ncbi:hypothetical protein HK104_010931 [Borealophlyctis nickersoniae]|nr:hypothetical protein HK104_010931 [Borealophlyctis nickersoniae]
MAAIDPNIWEITGPNKAPMDGAVNPADPKVAPAQQQSLDVQLVHAIQNGSTMEFEIDSIGSFSLSQPIFENGTFVATLTDNTTGQTFPVPIQIPAGQDGQLADGTLTISKILAAARQPAGCQPITSITPVAIAKNLSPQSVIHVIKMDSEVVIKIDSQPFTLTKPAPAPEDSTSCNLFILIFFALVGGPDSAQPKMPMPMPVPGAKADSVSITKPKQSAPGAKADSVGMKVKRGGQVFYYAV